MADVLDIFKLIGHVKAETACGVRQSIHAVLELAITMDWGHYNPRDGVLPVRGRSSTS